MNVAESKQLPVTYGLIVYYEDFSGRRDLTFHVSQRRDTISYIHFIRGSTLDDKLACCFNRMTTDEKYRILNHTFEELWFDLHSGRATTSSAQYETAQKRFAGLWSEGLLPKLINESTESISLDWGFPKGRKKHHQEPDLVCALREYREETHSTCYLEFLHHSPFIYETATQRIIYYVARSKFKPKPKYYTLEFGSLRRESISEETADLKWATFYEAKKLLSVPLFQVLEEVHKYLKETKRPTFLVLQDVIAVYGSPSGLPSGSSSSEPSHPVDSSVETSQ